MFNSFFAWPENFYEYYCDVIRTQTLWIEHSIARLGWSQIQYGRENSWLFQAQYYDIGKNSDKDFTHLVAVSAILNWSFAYWVLGFLSFMLISGRSVILNLCMKKFYGSDIWSFPFKKCIINSRLAQEIFGFQQSCHVNYLWLRL